MSGSNGGDTCIDAFETCNNIFDQILGIAGNINVRKNNIYVRNIIPEVDFNFTKPQFSLSLINSTMTLESSAKDPCATTSQAWRHS